MNSPLVQKLTGVRDLKRILETTVKELGDHFSADACQILLSNPLDPNVTSICEYRSTGSPIVGRSTTLPLVLQGRTFGSMTMSRSNDVTPDELNMMRVVLGELGDIIRLAQINDIVQRDTFRDTFLVEIGNLMTYSLGIGDALFMVVNILGKALNVSRCLFICTDDQQAGWKCYEFWQQDKVQSLQQCYWPSGDSALVAQTLLAREPLKLFEGQQNSYVSPAQEELQLIAVKSLLGVSLRSQFGTHGCVILQQCDYRRAWTRNEIDMVQNVADKVAEALYKLPAEKKAREPIMQLHQRIVNMPTSEGSKSAVDVRRALKGALGQQAIPQANKTGQMPVPPAAKVAPPPPVPPKPIPAPAPAPAPAPIPAQAPTPSQARAQAQAPVPAPASTPVAAPIAANLAASSTSTSGTAGNFDRTAQVQAQEITGEFQGPQVAQVKPTISAVRATPPLGTVIPPAALEAIPLSFSPGAAVEDDPYADLDFGDIDIADEPVAATGTAAPSPWGAPPDVKPPSLVVTAAPEPAASASPTIDVTPPAAATPAVDPIWGAPPAVMAPAPAPAPVPAPQPAPAPAPVAAEVAAPPIESASDWGNLDSIPTPKAESAITGAASAEATDWGKLDSIPTPGGAGTNSGGAPPPRGGLGGLGGMMMGKARAGSGAGPLKNRLGSTVPPASQAPPQLPPQPPAAEIDEVAAQKKLDQLMSNSNETSDYIFATGGLDARMLGRIDGWVSQIEAKDKYANGHAKPVAEISCAIAKEMGLDQDAINHIRQAALVHDLGKMGAAAQILQKAEDDLADSELLLVMNHPMDGAELLESFPDLKHLAPIVRAHHEEFDGNGFPHGLKGDEIPLAARIVGLANRYHELASTKRTGPGKDPTSVQSDFVENAGKAWDPNVVQAFIQAVLTGKIPSQFS